MTATSTLEKDYYTILGVVPAASVDQIKAAYHARVKISHPDRFDKNSHPEEWEMANAMLRDLNDAYAILQDAKKRGEYDLLRSGQTMQSPSQPHTEGRQPDFNASCNVRFDELPYALQQRLVERQRNVKQDQFQAPTETIFAKYFAIVILPCWFVYLYVASDSAKWSTGTNSWQAMATLAVGWFIAEKITAIMKWHASALKSYFYVTPLYYIKTNCDNITFWPILALRDIAVTHRYSSGIYENSVVLLEFEGHVETLTLSGKDKAENLLIRLKAYDERLRKACATDDDSYFLKNDDFANVPRTTTPIEKTVAPALTWRIRAAAIAACGVAYVFFVAVNDNFADQKWVKHSTQSPSHVASPPKRAPKPSIPLQPLPFNGEVQTFTAAERIAPFEIRTASKQHHLVKLVDARTKTPVLTVFVVGGNTVTVDVPLGTYEVRFACGNAWYGYEYLFGDKGSYSRANSIFTFSESFGHTITLYPVANGNLRKKRISPTAF